MSSCQPASSAPLPLPSSPPSTPLCTILLTPVLDSIEISQAMNIFALLVNPSQPHPLHPSPLPAMAFCQCIDPTCILWSKLAFDIYAGCQADGQRLKILPLLSLSLSWSWSPATALDHCHQREQEKQKGKGRGKGKGEREPRPFVLVIVTCVFCFCFPLQFLTQPFFQQSLLAKLSIPRVAFGVWGRGLNLFGHFSCH